MIKVVSWNVAQQGQTVAELRDMYAAVALLQEAGPRFLEETVNTGGDVGVSRPDSWEPWPREH